MKRHLRLVIPLYKNVVLAKQCISSILNWLPDIEDRKCSFLIVNDSPDDKDLQEYLESVYSKLPANSQMIINETNLGFVKSVNKALNICIENEEDAVLINSDTITFSGTLSEILAIADTESQVAFICPRSNNAAISTLPHCLINTTTTSPEDAYSQWGQISKFLPRFHYAPTAVGFYLYIRWEVLTDFGILDEGFGKGYEEENDLVLRANKVGYKAVLANHAFAFHVGSASFNETSIDLDLHKKKNLDLMSKRHPEFLPSVDRYHSSAHFQTEALLSGLIKTKHGKLKIAVDLFNLSAHTNGTSELAVKAIHAVHSVISTKRLDFELVLHCSKSAFMHHGFHTLSYATLGEESSSGYAVSLSLGQPFDCLHIERVENKAPLVVYGMLDTIALDCGHLSYKTELLLLWQHVADNANALFFISRFSQNSFEKHFRIPLDTSIYTRLLSTAPIEYLHTSSVKKDGDFVLVLGNHFAHKASVTTAHLIATAYPELNIVSLGAENKIIDRVTFYKSGELTADLIRQLFSSASLIILPSYVEGFGFGLMHAISNQKRILARDIPATREILNSFEITSGIHLYSSNKELMQLLPKAQKNPAVYVSMPELAVNWQDWGDGLMQMIQSLVQDNSTLYEKSRKRISAFDSLQLKLGITDGGTSGELYYRNRSAHNSLGLRLGSKLDKWLQRNYQITRFLKKIYRHLNLRM